MQNNVTELTQRLLRALDSNYNVIDMPEVVDIISLLEKMAITKELLQTTRLGKYVNELRRKTTDQELWRRAKELVRKWRSMVLPETNGQIRNTTQPSPSSTRATTPNKLSPPLQGQSLRPAVSPIPPKKLSPPIPAQQMVSPALQSRLVSPGPQGNKLVSPQLQKRLVSPSVQSHPLASPHKMVSPGALKVSPKLAAQAQGQKVGGISPPLTAGQNADVNLNQLKNKKRPAGEALDSVSSKRFRLNGAVTDLDFSDSSNSSFTTKPEVKREVIVINSDSNSSFYERTGDPQVDQQQPKKRGRKKGSKNHKNLLDEAETSFTNKLAVSASRGASKVKTTQEILAGIQNKNSLVAMGAAGGPKPSKEDLEEKAAKLTERVSIIDQKLNANAHRNKVSQKNKLSLGASKPNERVIESGSVINDKSLIDRLKREEEEEDDDEEIVVVDDAESADSRTEESQETEAAGGPLRHQEVPEARSLSEEEALAQLPPIDKSVLEEVDPEPPCTCFLKENKPSDFSIGEEEDEEGEQPPPFEVVEDSACPAKDVLATKYRIHDVSDDKILRLHEACLPNVNGNWSMGTPRPEPPKLDGLYVNVVPNIYERLDKDVRPFDSFKKYSVSKGDSGVIKIDNDEPDLEGSGTSVTSDSVIKTEPQDPDLKTDNSEKSDIRTAENEVFREWYECVDKPSYNGDTLRILPYCIVD